MSEIQIREAKREDAEAMAALTAAAWQTAYTGVIDAAYIATRTAEYYTPKFQTRIAERQWKILVAEAEGHVVGYATGDFLSAGSADCEVKGLYVHSQYQGKGIGRRLLDAMRQHFQALGCQHMIVWSTRGAKNNGFYRRMGGVAEEEKEEELGGRIYGMVGFGFALPRSQK